MIHDLLLWNGTQHTSVERNSHTGIMSWKTNPTYPDRLSRRVTVMWLILNSTDSIQN